MMARALDDGYTMLFQQHTLNSPSLQRLVQNNVQPQVTFFKIKAYADKAPYTVAPRELSRDFAILSQLNIREGLERERNKYMQSQVKKKKRSLIQTQYTQRKARRNVRNVFLIKITSSQAGTQTMFSIVRKVVRPLRNQPAQQAFEREGEGNQGARPRASKFPLPPSPLNACHAGYLESRTLPGSVL